MQDFRKKQSVARRLLSFAGRLSATLLLMAFAFVSVRAAWDMYGTFKVAAQARESTLHQLNALNSDEARVEAAVGAFETPSGMEAQMRDRFGVARPGEGEIHIVRDEEASDTASQPQEPFLARMFHALFSW